VALFRQQAHCGICLEVYTIHEGFSGLLNRTGKRYNVLQRRLDSWDYSLDQLLLGTMLFTLVTFLSPTIIVYYGLFATVSDLAMIILTLTSYLKARLAIMLLHATLETPLAFMNHFPLFVLMLRVKDPLRLPGGIVFVPSKQSNAAEIKVRVVLASHTVLLMRFGIERTHSFLWHIFSTL
jgi:hypothetical protein